MITVRHIIEGPATAGGCHGNNCECNIVERTFDISKKFEKTKMLVFLAEITNVMKPEDRVYIFIKS